MRPAILKTLFLTLLLAFAAGGTVNAKVASGPQNLGLDLHQAERLLEAAPRLGWSGSSYDATSGSPVVTRGIDDVINSALRPARAGSQDSRALQALKKKIDRGNDAFSGLPKTQKAANDLIRQTLSVKNPIVRTRTRNGQTVRDVFDPNTGRGVRTIDGEFDTFVNLN